MKQLFTVYMVFIVFAVYGQRKNEDLIHKLESAPVSADFDVRENDEEKEPIGEWIHWDDGVPSNALGLGSPTEWATAARFTPDDIAAFEDWELTRVRIGVNQLPDFVDITVWQGESEDELEEMVRQNFEPEEGWNMVHLDEPYEIDVTKELWIGVVWGDPGAGVFPPLFDSGPAEPGKGGKLVFPYPEGEWQNIEDLGFDGNWNIQGFLYGSGHSDIIYGDGVTDIDGNEYVTVVIGEQEWMAENLRVTQDAEGNEISRHCYDNDSDWCELYGGLYTWHTIMNGENSSDGNPSGVQGICPDGWHVPSHNEWTQLEQFICNVLGNSDCETKFPYDHSTYGNMGTNEGNALKSCRQVDSPLGGDCDTSEHPRWDSHSTNYGFDEFGFSALPGGWRWPAGGSDYIGVVSSWWSSTQSSTMAWCRGMTIYNGGLNRDDANRFHGFHLRCVRDITEEPTTYNLHLEANPENAGTVSGAGEYQEGEDVTIEATANAGWDFIEWTGDTDFVDDPYSHVATVTMPTDDVELTANFQQEDDSDIIYGDGVTDIDGNEYVTVIIGEQEWMAENLRVTRYNNEDDIPTGLNDEDWGDTTEGAYAIFDHNHEDADGINSPEEMVDAYGKLYNWYAVDDDRGLCPEGWGVPSDDDWTALVNFIMDEYDYHNEPWIHDINGVANALKSCRQVDSPLGGDCDTSEHPRWDSHITHYGFDEFGFSALPGGFRWIDGSFASVWVRGSWWSSTEHSSSNAWCQTMLPGSGSVSRFDNSKSGGFSLRCVRDITEEPTTYNLHLEANPENAGTVSGAGEYQEGEEVTIEATANAGWAFVHWTGDTDYINDPYSASTMATMPNANITLTAIFEEDEQDAMILVFNTELGAGTTITLPLSGTVDVTIDWGDDNLSEITAAEMVEHTYAEEAEYTVRISGQLQRFGQIGGYDNAEKLTEVTSFGNLGVSEFLGAFWGC